MYQALEIGQHIIDRHLNGESVLTSQQRDNLEAWLLGHFGYTNAGPLIKMSPTDNTKVHVMLPPPRYKPTEAVDYGHPMEERADMPILVNLGPTRDSAGELIVKKQPAPAKIKKNAIGLMKFGG